MMKIYSINDVTVPAAFLLMVLNVLMKHFLVSGGGKFDLYFQLISISDCGKFRTSTELPRRRKYRSYVEKFFSKGRHDALRVHFSYFSIRSR